MQLSAICSSLYTSYNRQVAAVMGRRLTCEVSFALMGAVVFALQVIPFYTEILFI